MARRERKIELGKNYPSRERGKKEGGDRGVEGREIEAIQLR